MNPEEKAKELVKKFKNHIPLEAVHDWGGGGGADYFSHKKNAKACALIAVDEMIVIQEDFYGLVLTTAFRDRVRKKVEYLKQVKQAIEKL